jgi:hypothetical protein
MPRTRERLRRLRDYGLERCNQYIRVPGPEQTPFWWIIRRGMLRAWEMFREGPYLEETRDGEQG